MIKHQMFIGMALIAGVAAGYFMRGDGGGAKAPSDEPAPAPARRGRIADDGEKASVRSLRRRIAELERMLAAKGLDVSNAVAEVRKIVPEGGDRRDPRAWLENLRNSDPQRYAQMTNRFARWRRHRSERARSTIDFLSSIDTSQMSEGAQKTHKELQGRHCECAKAQLRDLQATAAQRCHLHSVRQWRGLRLHAARLEILPYFQPCRHSGARL